MNRLRKTIFVLAGAIAVLAAAAPALAFPTQSTVNETHGGCQTSQTALAAISGGQYKLTAWHEDYLSCVGTVYSKGKINDGSQIIETSWASSGSFAQPSDLLASYYYYGYAWGKSSADSVEWGTLSVAP